MRYETAEAFRATLEQRLKSEAEASGTATDAPAQARGLRAIPRQACADWVGDPTSRDVAEKGVIRMIRREGLTEAATTGFGNGEQKPHVGGAGRKGFMPRPEDGAQPRQ